MALAEFTLAPEGPFDLINQSRYFGGWLSPAKDAEAIVMAFPIEGWLGSAAVVLRQSQDGKIAGKIFGPAQVVAKAREQALAVLSLDVDGKKWPEVGKRDDVIGNLQKKYNYLRPVLFHSPYEAAAAFIIGHRASIKQRQAVMRRMAVETGDKIDVDGEIFHAFPGPRVLKSINHYRGLNDVKIARLQAVADAAIAGLLDRQALRTMPADVVLAMLRELPGIGPFFARGILYRGAGLVDGITDDDVSRYAIATAYGLTPPLDNKTILKISEAWAPFRMWALVLLHVWVRREVGLPQKRTFSGGKQRDV